MNPRAKKAKALKPYRIEVEFTNGEIRRFDMAPLLEYPVYQPLKSNSLFEKVFVSEGVVQWPGEIDVSPDLLYMDSQSVA